VRGRRRLVRARAQRLTRLSPCPPVTVLLIPGASDQPKLNASFTFVNDVPVLGPPPVT
jgi:hypothetical protein